jgi:hypothetical protein
MESTIMGRRPIGDHAMTAAERQRRRRAALRDSQPVTERAAAPVPPDEARDREIKRLKTRVSNLSHELRDYQRYHAAAMEQTGGMSFGARGLIARCLHPDQRANATDADRDAAFKALSSWFADVKQAKARGQR